MSVSNYTPSSAICKYTYSKLKDVIYLVSKDHLKDVHIDNGEAYISGLTELPLRLNGFNIQLNEESSLDERYKFQKTVTLSMHKYVNSSIFGGRYYVILESTDGTFWMVNVDFPSRVTYTFNLSQNQYQTDFTLSSLSNFPTLKLNGNFEAEEPVCLGFNVYGIQSLKLLEKDLCSLDTANKVVTTYTSKQFQEIEYLGESCSLQESFDGRKVSTQIQFNIGFDAYKSSWHYNLLEFVQNLYSAIIVPKGSDNVFFCGFNFGLQPSFVVQTQSEAGASDIITITLIEASNHGSTASVDWSEEQETTTRWVYPKTVGNTICWECVGFGTAKYLVQQEVTVNGTPTGNYKVLEGYASQFPNLNIVGTFSNVETFSNYECGGEQCNVSTNLPLTITYNAQTCYTYSYSASCDWNVSNVPSYITVSPSNGSANSAYTLTVCNTNTPTSGETSSFTITSGNNSRVVNVVLTPESSILTPQTQYINCLQQNVTFTYDSSCPITVTSIDQRLTYQITNSQFVVNVPRNNSTTSAITWSIGIKDCHNDSGTSYIVQDKTYEKWVNTSGYICESGNSYVEQVRYTGTTSSNTNTMTSEYRKGDLIQSGDSRCNTEYTRWTRNTTDYYCIDGDKWSFDEQEVSNDGTNWTKNGNTRLGEMVESASSFCNEEVEYKWVLTDRWTCDYTPSPTPPSPSGLPSGYTEVEYVENQDNAYINTLFKPNQDTRIVAEMQCVTSTNSVMHFGAGGWDRVNGMWLTYETGINGTLHVAWLGKTTWSTYGNGDYNKHTYDWNKNELYKDGTLVGSSTYGTYQCVNNLAIFAQLQGDPEVVGGLYMKGKMYSFKMYDNDTLIRDFIPCTRDSDSKVGVYDIVNNQFYSSANSGYELVAGPTV